MKKTLGKYSLYVSVFILSFLIFYMPGLSSIFKDFLAIPIVSSLLFALYESYKNNRLQQHDIEMQNKEQDFVFATASHMAVVAYDKHVLFCEEYVSRIQTGLQELLRDGPTRNALNIGRELVQIRQKHAAWLTIELETKLKPFEEVLINIGAKEPLIDKVRADEQRAKIIEEVYKSFEKLLFKEVEKNKGPAVTFVAVIEEVREILGIDMLTKLRLNAAKIVSDRFNS